MASDEGSRPSTSNSPDEPRGTPTTPRLAPEDINSIAGAVADILRSPPTESGAPSTIEARTGI